MKKVLSVFLATMLLLAAVPCLAAVQPTAPADGVFYDFEGSTGGFSGAAYAAGAGRNGTGALQKSATGNTMVTLASPFNAVKGETVYSYDVFVPSSSASTDWNMATQMKITQDGNDAWRAAAFHANLKTTDGKLYAYNKDSIELDFDTWYKVTERCMRNGYQQVDVTPYDSGKKSASFDMVEFFTQGGNTYKEIKVVDLRWAMTGTPGTVYFDNVCLKNISGNAINDATLDSNGNFSAGVELTDNVATAEIQFGGSTIATVTNNVSGSYSVTASGVSAPNYGTAEVTMVCKNAGGAVVDTMTADCGVTAPDNATLKFSDLTADKASEAYIGTNYSDGNVTSEIVELKKDTTEGWLGATYKAKDEALYHFVLSGDSNNRRFNNYVLYTGINKASFEIYLPSESSSLILRLCIAKDGQRYGSTNGDAVLNLNSSNLTVGDWTPVTVWHDVSGGTWRYQVGSAVVSAWTTTGYPNNTGFGGLAFKLNEVSATNTIRFRNYTVETVEFFTAPALTTETTSGIIPADTGAVTFSLGSLSDSGTGDVTVYKDGVVDSNVDKTINEGVLTLEPSASGFGTAKYTVAILNSALDKNYEIPFETAAYKLFDAKLTADASEAGKWNASVDYINSTGASVNAKLLLVSYTAGGAVNKIVMSDADALGTGVNSLTASIVPNLYDSKVVAYVWDNISGLKPLCEAKTFPMR